MFIHRLYNGKHFPLEKKQSQDQIHRNPAPSRAWRPPLLCTAKQQGCIYSIFSSSYTRSSCTFFPHKTFPPQSFNICDFRENIYNRHRHITTRLFFHNFLSCCLRPWLAGCCVDLFNVREDGCVILAGGVFGAHTVLAGVFAYHVADFKVGEPVMAGGLALFRGGILGDVVFVAWVVLDAVVQVSPGDFGLRVGLDTALQENVVSVFGVLHLVDARLLEFGGQGTDAAAPFCWRRIRMRKKTFIYIFLSLCSKTIAMKNLINIWMFIFIFKTKFHQGLNFNKDGGIWGLDYEKSIIFFNVMAKVRSLISSVFFVNWYFYCNVFLRNSL